MSMPDHFQMFQGRKHRVAHQQFSRTRAPMDEILTAQALIDAEKRAAHEKAVALVETRLGGVVLEKPSQTAPLVNALMAEGFFPDDRLSDMTDGPYMGLFAEEIDQN